MNNRKAAKTSLADVLMTVAGVIISIAGIIYIIKQYKKLLSYLLTTPDDESEEQKKSVEKRMNYQFKQIYSDDETEKPYQIEDDDISAVID